MKGDKKDLLLLFNDLCKLFLILPKVSLCLFILLHILYTFHVLIFLLKFFNPNNIPFDFVINYLNGCISNLIGKKELMKLGKVALSLKDIQQVQSELNALFVVISEGPTHCAEQSIVFQHNLHIFIA